MCASLIDLDHVAQECGWYGWTRGSGAAPTLAYVCGCGEHWTYIVSETVDDTDYYARRCEFIRTCKT